MMKKITCLILIIFLSLSICVSPISAETILSLHSVSLTAEQTIEGYVKVLCSEAFGGRKTGSFGNELTTEWLSGMLEGIGITPYENNDYRMGFTTKCYNFERLEMTVYEKSGIIRSLIPGKDFYISLTSNFDIKLTKDDISFLSFKNTSQDENMDYAFREVDSFNSSSFTEKITPQYIQVTSDTFRYLVETDIEYIHIVNEVSMEEKEVYNVVGIIPGSNRDKSVVLSAHFDHMGQLGESIFKGAVDNASGTVALLYLAELLLQKSEGTPFDFDIIIAFCNDEENGRNGSKSLAPILKNEYENLFNINIDCVGIAGTDNIYSLSNVRYQTLASDMKPYMDKHRILYDDNASYLYLSSDSRSFETHDIPTVSFIADRTTGLIHTTSDTCDKLDYAQIINLCAMITEFVLDKGSTVYEASTNLYQPLSYLPDNIALNFATIIEKVKSGDEAHFDDEMASHMLFKIYTYDDYLKISEKLSVLRKFNDYHLGFIEKSLNRPISRLIYLRDVPSTELNALQISLATHFTYDIYFLSPIGEMEGYFSVSSFKNPDLIYGFLYVDDDRTYFFEFGNILASLDYVFLSIDRGEFAESGSLETFIKDFNVEDFIERWKDFNLE